MNQMVIPDTPPPPHDVLPTPGKGKGQSDAWKALYSHLNNNKKQFPVYKWSSENQMIF